MADLHSLQELCDLAGVTERTVRYYISQGLLPSPGVGRGVRYGPEHLARLRLIRRHQEAFLPLAEIRARLEKMSQAQIQEEEGAASPQSASDYVQHLLGRRSAPAADPTKAQPSPLPPSPPPCSTWEHITLSPDLEIHIRRPLTRTANRRTEQLVAFARTLFQEEER